MRKLWNNPDRGSVPIGWTLSPAMVDAMPGALNYYHKTSTDNDNLISGPSGYGYTYPNRWFVSNLANQLADFVVKAEEYNEKAGIRVVTVWNTITGGINVNVGNIFADNSSTLLGLTAQNTGGALSIYNGKLPGKPLSCNYCTGEQAMIDHIASGAKGWDGTAPRFLIIQAQPWNNVTPTSFKNVANSLGADYKVVRPDHIFQLIREANGLTINPGAIEGDGDGLTGEYFNGVNFDTKISTRVDPEINFHWGTGSPLEGVDADNFSVRWTGELMPLYTGEHTFYLTCDDGARLWVNNELIIDKWTNNAGETFTGNLHLNAGKKYPVKLEYYDRRGTALCQLEWASPLHSRELIPRKQLFQHTSSGMTDVSFSDLQVFLSSSGNGIIRVDVNGCDGNEEIILTTFDSCGQIVQRQEGKAEKQYIDLSGRPKGMYLISVRTKKQVKVMKYIIG